MLMLRRFAALSKPRSSVVTFSTSRETDIQKLDEQARLAAEEKIEKEIEQRKTPMPARDYHRVPHVIMPWQKKWFPNERFVLVSPKELDLECTELSFKVPPHLTKHEITDTLRAVYGFDVASVTTVIRLGKEKLPAFSRKSYRRPTYKLARVLLHSPYKVQQPSNQRQPVRAVYEEEDENK